MENKISVLIISRNSEDTIKDCLNSLKKLADEIIVVDSGSTDSTRDIARKLGAKVVETEFKNFADQRNFAASLAGNEWIFYIDTDEKITEEFSHELERKIKLSGKETAGFWIKRKTYFLGRDWGFTDRVQRVFKKDKLKGWFGVVHETPKVDGHFENIEAPILHNTHRTLEQMVDKTNEWSEFEADLRLKSGHPKMSFWRFPRVMISGFVASYFGQRGYKNGTAGVIEGVYQAFSMFITYAKLWEKQTNSGK